MAADGRHYSLADFKLADFNLAVCYQSANPPNLPAIRYAVEPKVSIIQRFNSYRPHTYTQHACSLDCALYITTVTWQCLAL